MKLLPLACLLLSSLMSLNLLAGELITNHSELSNLRVVLQENLKGNYKYLTPMFRERGLPTMVTKNLNGKCHKIKIYSNSLSRSKINCNKKIKLTLKDFPLFQEVGSSIDSEDKTILLTVESASENFAFSYKGVSFPYFMRDLHSEVNGNQYRFENFMFNVSATSQFKIIKNKIELHQSVTFSRDDFFHFDKKQNLTKQKIDIKSGDLVFSGGDERYIIVKRFQPGKFRFKFLTLNPSYRSHIESIPSRLFRENGLSYCFMDYFINHSAYDCEYLAEKSTVKKEVYRNFDFIYVDLKNKSLRLL